LRPAKFFGQRLLANPEACRTATRVSTSRAYSADLRDFCMCRRA
jgi:hypothetical protein